jgi:hypothetical protein
LRLVWVGTFSAADRHGVAVSTPGRRDSEDVSFVKMAPLHTPRARTDKKATSRGQQRITNRSAGTSNLVEKSRRSRGSFPFGAFGRFGGGSPGRGGVFGGSSIGGFVG